MRKRAVGTNLFMYTYKDFEFNQADWYQKGNKVFPQKSSGSSPTKKQETAKKEEFGKANLRICDPIQLLM